MTNFNQSLRYQSFQKLHSPPMPIAHPPAHISPGQAVLFLVQRIGLHNHFLQLVGGVTVDAVLLCSEEKTQYVLSTVKGGTYHTDLCVCIISR